MSSSVQPAGSVGSSSAASARPSTEPRPLPAWFVEIVLPMAAIGALFVVWEAACAFFAVPSYIIPAPFRLVLSIASGLVSGPAELIELGRACRANRWTELWRIRLPYAVPFIFSGLKAAIALAVVGAVVAEFVNADAGLGYLIQTS